MTSAMGADECLGFIGGGAMAQAFAGGLLAGKSVTAAQILISDPDIKQRTFLRDSLGVSVTDNNDLIGQGATVLLLAVKPHVITPVLRALRPILEARTTRPLVISIAAGISLAHLASLLPSGTAVIRVVPNTPALVRAGISVQSANNLCSSSHLTLCSLLLSSVGAVLTLDESLLDAVTGLSGSGPAFVFNMIEALSDGGVRAGLPRSASTELALHTVRGAAQLALETGRHPGQLKDSVASPNGTTIRGLHELEKGAVRAAFISAVFAAAERATEMGAAYAAANAKQAASEAQDRLKSKL